MKKRIMVIYVEFFKNQQPAVIERMLRISAKQGGFPAFRRLMVGVDHKGLSAGKKPKEYPYSNIPLLIDESTLKGAKYRA